MEDMFVILLL